MVSLALYRTVYSLGLSFCGERLLFVLLPLAWAGLRTLSWACQTWTVTANRRLIVQKGILVPTRQVIHLVSVHQIADSEPLPLCWLGIGHIRFQATDPQGQSSLFHYTWLAHFSRFRALLASRGGLPVGRPPRPRWRRSVSRLLRAVRLWIQNCPWMDELVTRMCGKWCVADYERFQSFCHHLLRHVSETEPYPAWTPVSVARCWMVVLRQCHIVIEGPRGTSWRIAPQIHSLRDVCRRIGPEQLQRAVS